MSDTRTPRPAYTGPRTKWTFADGTYSLTFGFGIREAIAKFGQGDVEMPLAARVMNQFKGETEDPHRVSGLVGHYYDENHQGHSAVYVTFYKTFENDHEAAAYFRRMGQETGAHHGSVSYMQPTELGATASKETRVLEIRADRKPGIGSR